MGSNSVITMTAWRRPYYFKQAIESIKDSCGKIPFIIISVDGGYPDKHDDFLEIIKKSGLDYDIIFHDKNLGCAGNTGYVLCRGFSIAPKVIHIEEDVIVSRGFLLFMDRMLDLSKHNKSVFAVTGFNPNKKPPISYLNQFKLQKVFRCIGWGMWKDRFEAIKEWFGITWKPDRPFTDANVPSGDLFLRWTEKTDKGSWCWPMDKIHRNGRYIVAPYVSKVRHLGQRDGTFCKGNETEEPIWAGYKNIQKIEKEVINFHANFVGINGL